jgi:hypothetical protein
MTFDIPAIKTEFWAKPIPIRTSDWLAFYADDEPNDAGCMAVGEGATETDAIADLVGNHPREA